jgi:hypothetical protein
LCGPKIANHKSNVPKKEAVIDWIGLVSHRLGSVLGAIELPVLCAFVCIVGYFDAQIRRTNLIRLFGKM